MQSVVAFKSNDVQVDQQMLRRMFRFRHKVFRERLGWEVESRHGLEIDRYDELEPVYMVSQNDHQEIMGSWRLLPTMGPYMLKDTFPQLLRGAPAPQDPHVWEVSRFATVTTSHRGRVQANLGQVTFDMIRSLLPFAEEHGIRHYVFVTSVALERLVTRIGLPLRRFGDGRAQKVGEVLSVACWLDVNEQFRQAVVGAQVAVPAAEEAA
jgi:acyl homoserine lactone synthase